MLGKPRSISKKTFKSAADLPTLPDFAYQQLREQIVDGALPIDVPLRQEKLAKMLGLSRLPVREALARLEAEGLVILRPRRGYVVASLNAEEIQELFDLRMVLEEHGGIIATSRRTDKDVRDVETIFRKMYGMTIGSDKDLIVYSALNRDFHQRIFAASGRKRLCAMLTALQDNSERFTRIGAHLVVDLDNAHEEHRLIFEAFRKGEAELMGKLSRDHVRKIGERLLAVLEKERPPEKDTHVL
jgi:DNA-binding GntR family transcriptional regulator